MKVLILGKRGGILHWFENVLDAFKDLPEVEARAFCVNHGDWLEKLWRNILKKCSREQLDQIIADQFARQVDLFKPDLILIVDYFYIPEKLFQILSLRNQGTTVAWWIGDLFDRKLVSRHACVDKYYFTDSYFLDYAAEAGIHNTGYLPLAYNPEVFRWDNEGFRKSKLAFVGAYAENRAAILRQIEQPVLVVGKKWDRLGTTHHEIRARRVAIKDVAAIYNQHIGVLNIKNSGNVVNGLNMRTFDAPACGCVVINDALGDLDRCFDIGKELLVYHCPEELNEHYRRLLADDRERIRIAEAGRRRVLADHQYRHRIWSVLQELF